MNKRTKGKKKIKGQKHKGTKVKKRKTSQELRIATRRVVGCQDVQGVFTKRCHYNYFCNYCHFYYYHNLSCWVVTILFFSFAQFEFLSLVTIWSFKFCHNLFFLSFITVWVLKFCYNVFFLLFFSFFFFVLSVFDFFSFVNIRFF